MNKLLAFLLACVLGLGGYAVLSGALAPRTAPRAIPVQSLVGTAPVLDTSRCDGRTHCSQMTSCAEATYFIEHCPNTEMDGNGDGVPCEKQWCTQD